MATAFTDPSAQLDFPAFRPEMAFPPLPDAMVATIRSYASEVSEPAGVTIFARGQRGVDLFVVLEGNINIYTGGEESAGETVTDLGDHHFTGELNMLNDQPTLVGGRTTVPSVLLRVARGDLQRLMRAEGEIANLILQAFIWRRIGLASQITVGVTLVGNEGEAETLKLQRFLRRNGYPHHLASAEAYRSSSAFPPLKADSWPAVIFTDGRELHRPTVSKLADELGISELPDKDLVYDVAVVGAGPAGLAAAVYASSEGLSTVVIEGIAPGGEVKWSVPDGMHSPEVISNDAFNIIEIELKKPGTGTAVVSSLDPLKTDPKHYKLEFENAQVRVLRVKIEAHGTAPMHQHSHNRVTVFLTDQDFRVTDSHGKVERTNRKAGDAVWGTPTTHTEENLSDHPFEVVAIELKN